MTHTEVNNGSKMTRDGNAYGRDSSSLPPVPSYLSGADCNVLIVKPGVTSILLLFSLGVSHKG